MASELVDCAGGMLISTVHEQMRTLKSIDAVSWPLVLPYHEFYGGACTLAQNQLFSISLFPVPASGHFIKV
jgi:hypothetical protein